MHNSKTHYHAKFGDISTFPLVINPKKPHFAQFAKIEQKKWLFHTFNIGIFKKFDLPRDPNPKAHHTSKFQLI